MRPVHLVAAVAVLLTTSTAALEIQTADVAPLLNLIPGVPQFEDVTNLLGLPGLLDVLPATLLSPETAWDKVRAGLAGTGVWIIQIAAFIGFIFNYLDKLTESNLKIREAKEAAAEAAAAEAEAAEAEAAEAAEGEAEGEAEAAAEGGAQQPEGEERFIIVPYHSPPINPVINPRPNVRRVGQQPARRQYAPYPLYQQARPLRRQARPYRRQKRSETPPPPTPEEGVLGKVVQAGKHILWLLKKVFLKEAQKDTVVKELTEVIDILKQDLMDRLDHDGCLQKLVCHLQNKPKGTLTPEEDMMQVFFLQQTHRACAPQHFPHCFLSESQLDDLLINTPKTNLNMIL